MQIIGDVFNIILFVTVIGGAFSILALLINRIFHFAVPLWFSICQMAAYVTPLLTPGLYLIPPEDHSWRQGYYIACSVWFCITIILVGFDIIKTMLAHQAIRNYKVCQDKHINEICFRCVQLVGKVKTPSVCFGTLDDPACVIGVLRPVIILNETIIKQLTDAELATVLCHEITHIKRGHLLLERLYDYICILNWFNPFVWIAKGDFAIYCELDCDRSALASLQGEITNVDYAGAMLHLLELSSIHAGNKAKGMSALGFLVAKKRITMIMSKLTKVRKIVITVASVVLVAVIILFSLMLSREHFYPYPAYSKGVEYILTG